MPNNDKLPPEILRKILEELNTLDDRGTTLTQIIEDYAEPDNSTVYIVCNTAQRIDILSAMRVCRFWRNMVFDILYKEDTSNWKWTADDWTVCQRMFELKEMENRILQGPTSWDVPAIGRRGARKPGWGMWEQGDQW
ncbi:hypothetical protein PMZ80_007768 [Knufia obscura]|uniref:F-box domain-containing protein n=2 Tax=Knufia TaxID=430999 RepID=A0AAN8I6A9_9EURO|nr:hypothetical protein PMZ80_007768 [Knufia obscura]KAK5954304.1 hypothetical protein OHC33_004877 [Knufia fluminis]